MPFDFPNTPTVGQEFTSGSTTYVWNGIGWNYKSVASYLPLVGGTLTGDLTIAKSTPVIELRKTLVSETNLIRGSVGSNPRWHIALGNAVAESALNTGSDLGIARYTDAGVATATFQLLRADGMAKFFGDVTITKVRPSIILDKLTQTDGNNIFGSYNGVNRWVVVPGTNTPETGSNLGSNFTIHRYSDAGGNIGTPLLINRATGRATFESGIDIPATGIALGSDIAASPTDLSKHLSVWGGQYGLSVTPSSLNIVSAGAATIQMNSTTVTVNGGLNVVGRAGTFSPSNVDAASFLALSTSFGGGLTLQDGGYRACMWAQSANLALATGGNPPAIKLLLQNDNNHQLYGNLTTSGGNLATNRIDCTICYFGSGIYWNHEAGNARLASNQNVYSYGYVRASSDVMAGNGYYYLVDGSVWMRWRGDLGQIEFSHSFRGGGIYGSGGIESGAHIRSGNGYFYGGWGGQYFYFDGTNWQSPWGSWYIGGRWVARNGDDVTFNECRSSANHHSDGGHYFMAGDGVWMRWRGDLGRIDFSHNLELGTPNVTNYVWSRCGYACKDGENPGSYTFNISWGTGGGNGGMYIGDVYVGNVLACDHRIKRDIEPMPSVWNRVKRLRPIKYRHREYTPDSMKETAKNEGRPFWAGDDKEHWGFAAHEMQEILVESAATGSKDHPKILQSPNMLTIAAALTKALQEAMERIELLEAKLPSV
jgi:Chaperone of endosialidase